MNTINELEKELGVENYRYSSYQGVQIYKGIEKIFSKEELNVGVQGRMKTIHFN